MVSLDAFKGYFDEKVGLDDLYGALDAGDLASLLGELDLKAGDRARLKRALEASRAA